MLTLASFVVVVAGMKAATSILIPFLLSVFIAIVSGPALFGLKRVGVPTPIALLVVILVVILVGILVIGLVGNSITDFTKALPGYQERLEGVGVKVIDWLNENLSRFDIEIPTIRDTPEASSGLLPPDTSILGADGAADDLSEGTVGGAKNPFDAGFVMRLVGGMLSSLGAVLTNAFLILLTVIFILLEASSFPRKLRAILKDPEKSLGQYDVFIESVQKYMALKTVISAATGLAISIGLMIIGVDYAFLWGLLAFFFNYVPNIGSIIAAVPPILLAFIQFGTDESILPAQAIGTAVLFLVVNLTVGNVIEPRVMGKGVGLSTLVVFVSLVFWGWVLGPVGMLLSVPLTMTVKIALGSSESTKWLAILLDSDVSEEQAAEVKLIEV
ncbi:MAG: AI-2E family transporter [Candidatus Omnitrophica bacterium]|nr:AI-2E family transporter [Candidatus Omnitrophota bacterium]MCA9442665.1 AI-2E family transporter [Candidatus Omnitrophota bacterium]